MRATKGFSFAGQPTREAMFTPPRKQPVFKLWNVVVLLVFIGLVGIIFTQHNTLKKLRDGKAGDKLGVVQKGSSRTLNKAGECLEKWGKDHNGSFENCSDFFFFFRRWLELSFL
jgi:hypothetical protein